MGLVPRGLLLAATLSLGAAATGCGGSVADADASPAVRSTTPSSPFCTAARANSEAIRPLNELASRGGAPPEELSNTLDAVRRAGADLVASAPDDIRADVQRTVDAVGMQLDALVAAGGDAAVVSRDPELGARLGSPELADANRRVHAYVDGTCGQAAPTSR